MPNTATLTLGEQPPRDGFSPATCAGARPLALQTPFTCLWYWMDGSCPSAIAECLACRNRKSPCVPSVSMSRTGSVRCLGRVMALILGIPLLSYLNLGKFALMVPMSCNTQSGSTWLSSQQAILRSRQS